MGRCLSAVVVGLLAASHSLVAQDRPTAGPRVEIGLNGGFLGGVFDVSEFQSDIQLSTAGFAPGCRINLSERFALEGIAIADHVEGMRLLTYEMSLVIKRSARPRSRSVRFLRLGGGGRYESERVLESRRENQDHSITVFPPYDHRELTPPDFVLVGIGVRRVVSRHLAITAEVDGIGGKPGFGIQASAGLVVPIGSYRAP